jgi:choline-sulfatase
LTNRTSHITHFMSGLSLPPVCLFLLLVGCSERPRPSVLLVTIDTLRADRLGCYGYEGAQTPNIDGLASEGVLFEQVGAQVPVTLPSHATILTGLLPASHGVHDNSTFCLAGDVTTLAEVFERAGYRTGAMIGAYVLARQFGLSQGFAAYEDSFPECRESGNPLRRVERPAAEVARSGIEWLSAQGQRPFFLWLHFFDPHASYNPPKPFSERFPDTPYDGEVAYVDQEIGRVLGYLAREGLDRRSLVVITSDHGEGLGQHDEDTHSVLVYETTMRVPLIMRWIGRLPGGLRIHELARTTDITPTVLELVGLHPPDPMDGASLVPVLRGDEGGVGLSAGESMLALYHFGLSPLISVRTGRWKYIAAPHPELYDLVHDSNEEINVVDSFPAVADSLSRAALQYAAAVAAGEPAAPVVSAGEGDKLEALGYLPSPPPVSTPAVSEWRHLPDPKDHRRLMSLAIRASGLIGENQAHEALPLLDEAFDRGGSIPLLRRLQATAYFRLGRLDEAVDALRSGMAADSSYAMFPKMLGELELERGKPQEALEALDVALRLIPFDPWSLHLRGKALVGLGRIEEAADALGTAIRLQPSFWEARLLRSRALLSCGHPDSALEEAARVLGRSTEVVQVHILMARCYEALGRWTEAADAYAWAVRADSTLVQAHLRMAWCYHRAGSEDKAARALEDHAERYEEDGEVLALVGAGRAAMGDTAGAVAAWERAVELDSTMAPAWAGLMTVEARRGVLAMQEVAERALSACPGDTALQALLERLIRRGQRSR